MEVYMKLTKKQTIAAIFSIIIFVAATTLSLMSGLVEGFKFWIPILNFFFFLFLGFSILFYVCAFVKAHSFFYFLGCVLILPCFVYAAIMFKLPWWAVVIVAIMVVAVTIGISFIVAGDNTEGIALNAREDDKNKK